MACATDSTTAFTSFVAKEFISCESQSPDSGFGDQNGNLSSTDHQNIGGEEVGVKNVRGGHAVESVTLPESIEGLTNTERLVLIQKILDIFFSNGIKEAEAAVEPFKDKCVHFSHSKLLLSSIAAFLTLDPVSIFSDISSSSFSISRFANRLSRHTFRV